MELSFAITNMFLFLCSIYRIMSPILNTDEDSALDVDGNWAVTAVSRNYKYAYLHFN